MGLLKRMATGAVLLAALQGAAASAQTLPDVNCFSPGLERFAQAMQDGLSVRAEFNVGSALYVRDLTVLGDMLSGASFLYDGTDTYDRLRIFKGADTLLDAARLATEDGTRLCLDGTLYAPDEALLASSRPDLPAMPELLAVLSKGILSRLPLEELETALCAPVPGDTLMGGLRVARAFTAERTLSGDALSVVRLDVSGALAMADGRIMEVQGFFKRPTGRKVTDSFELQGLIDEDNRFTVSGSAERTAQVTRRDAEGTNSVRLRLTSQGRWRGSRIDSRITLNLTNKWQADAQGALGEALTASLHVGHTDRTPGRQMLRLNDLSGDLRTTLQLTTRQEDTSVSSIGGLSLELVMDGNTFLSGSMQTVLTAGLAASMPDMPQGDAIALSSADDVRALAQQKVFALARALYAELGEDSLSKVQSGLNR